MAALTNKVLRSQVIFWSSVRPVLASQKLDIGGVDGRQPSRGFPTSKHWLIKWRLLRSKKVLQVLSRISGHCIRISDDTEFHKKFGRFMEIELPKFVELKSEKKNREDKTPDELRMEMKKEGRLPPRTFQELPLNISCTRSVMEPFKPPEGDGKHSSLLSSHLSDTVSRMLKGPKSLNHIRKLKKFENFNESEFALEAQNIVIEAQMLLQDIFKNQERLHELVTEKAFPEMVHGLEYKTMVWSLVETVEPPKVVHVRTETMITDDNVFSQVTVRLHTKQILAIYDRFGRLMYGDPILPKSVVEYVIMEKWISDTYGRWRIHGKILPDSATPRDNLIKTYKVPKFSPLPPAEINKETTKETKVDKVDTPELATA